MMGIKANPPSYFCHEASCCTSSMQWPCSSAQLLDSWSSGSLSQSASALTTASGHCTTLPCCCMQVFFSSRNPLLRWKLPLLHKLLYNNGTWSYFCTIITTWTFLLVPFISLMFEIQPVKFGPEFALAASLYLFSNFVVSC